MRIPIDRSDHLKRLSFTRFFAALVVVFFHFGTGVSFISDEPWTPILTAGPLAVSFFFTLSGYVMAVVYGDMKKADRIGFWIARFARIYPLYIAVLLWFIAARPSSFADNLLHVLLLQAWIPGKVLDHNPVGWSLSVEGFFYVCFPMLAVLAQKLGRRRWTALVAAVWIGSQVVTHVLSAAMNPQIPSLQHDFIYFFPIFHLNAFMVGMLAGSFVAEERAEVMPGWLIALGSFLTVCLIVTQQGLIAAVVGFQPVLLNGALAPLFALLLRGIGRTRSKFLMSRPCVYLGEASYAVYILQMVVAILFSRHVGALNPISNAKFWGMLSVLLVTSCIAYSLVETPLRRLIRNFYCGASPTGDLQPQPSK
jgi:peptidoglycan/LPS O-acetylase OafA/YrhL